MLENIRNIVVTVFSHKKLSLIIKMSRWTVWFKIRLEYVVKIKNQCFWQTLYAIDKSSIYVFFFFKLRTENVPEYICSVSISTKWTTGNSSSCYGHLVRSWDMLVRHSCEKKYAMCATNMQLRNVMRNVCLFEFPFTSQMTRRKVIWTWYRAVATSSDFCSIYTQAVI